MLRALPASTEAQHFDCAIDYGCGVGRLSAALADRCTQVVGLDISPSMLQAARGLSEHDNTDFRLADPALTNLPPSYDLVFSYIVFQHIPPKRGAPIIERLLAGLVPNGSFVLHLTYCDAAPLRRRIKAQLLAKVPLVRFASNIAHARPAGTATIPMYSYDLNDLNKILASSGCGNYRVTPTDHGGYLGVLLTGNKDATGPS